ncbi:hypothetical protein TruAng_007139 [Truncatella angustata]|nr:hypothetical protein TruAng_007139 [Truncatella angustata]
MRLYRHIPEANHISAEDLNSSLLLNISLFISDPMMVDAMSRPLSTWASEPSYPRCYPQELPGPGTRLPPISSAPTSVTADLPSSTAYEARRSVSTYRDPHPVANSQNRVLPDSPTARGQHVITGSGTYYAGERSIRDPTTNVRPTDRLEEISTLGRNHLATGTSYSGAHFGPTARSPHERPHEPVRRFSGVASPRSLLLHTGTEARPEQIQRSLPSPSRTWSTRSDTRPPERVRISDLLTNDQDPPPKNQAEAQISPSRSQPQVRTNSIQSPGTSAIRFNYALTIRQQPMAARSCGFGERDRRVIDPPPIVEVKVDDPLATPGDVREALRIPFMVMHCTIWDDTGKQDISFMPEEYRQQRRLMGTAVASPFTGRDETGVEGCFFCFPDLSVRTSGTFKLKFILVMADPLINFIGARHRIRASAISEVFTVYSAKDFPGMQASTPLTKKLKEQGCLISIKKGNERGGRGRNDSDDDDSDDDNGDTGASTTGRRKKQRK